MNTSRPPGFGERLRQAREHLHLTQEQLAERLGVSVASINRWEHEKAFPRAGQRRAIAELFGVRADALFAGSSDGETPEHGRRSDPAPHADSRIDVRDTRGGASPASSASSPPAADSPFWDIRPVRALDLGDPLLKQGRRPVAAYFARPCFAPVREAVRLAARDGRGGAVLFGPPMVGKTRMALEALRHEAPDFLLVPWPRHEFASTALDEFRGGPVALLLDDLHELAYQHEVGRIFLAVRRLLDTAARLLVVATSRSGVDEAATHQHYDGLIESLGLHVAQLPPMARDAVEAERFFAFVHDVAARDPARQLSVDAFDGTPGSVLLGLERRTTQLRSPRFPSAAKAILKALALLRSSAVYEYPESRVRRVAEQVFELAPAQWSDALDYLVGAGWVTLDEGDLRGESQLYVPSDAYLDVCLIESGVYPRSNRRITSDFPKVAEALARTPRDCAALFALSRAIYHARGDISTKWNELGLTCALRGLEPLDPAREPLLWARGQQILGMSFWKRWEGSFEDNARRAIEALQAAQTVLTRDAFPSDWASLQHALGVAYFQSEGGSSAELTERGIACLTSALQVYTRETSPYDWARMHSSLGTAYDHRVVGERVDNLDQAIEHYLLAAEVLTREAFPGDWALLMRNLAETRSQRHAGDPRQNQEAALAYCRAVLDEEMRERYPYDWARAHCIMAAIYCERLTGTASGNLRTAIAHYAAALDVLTAREYGPDRALVLAHLERARAALHEADQTRAPVIVNSPDGHPDAPIE